MSNTDNTQQNTATDPWGNPQADVPADSTTPATDPWASADTTNTASADPWGGGADAASATSSTDSWLNVAPVETTHQIDWAHPFHDALIPLGHWVEVLLNSLVTHGRPFFQAIRIPVDFILSGFQTVLVSTPSIVMLIILSLLAWQLAGKKIAASTFGGLLLIGLIGVWSEAMITLALVLTSVFFCLIIGIPMGIWLARSPTASKIVRPILDTMQTTPAFVYLIPIVMLFGIGNVPGVVVTIIFALTPIVRLTILGIQQVPKELIEAGHAFGASPKQMLYRIQLPIAMPTIMAGVNQTLMLALSMVVIASMIAVGGLGLMVLRGIGRLDIGLAAVGGVGIVILAILLDRITQKMGQTKRTQKNKFYQKGPIGMIYQLVTKTPKENT